MNFLIGRVRIRAHATLALSAALIATMIAFGGAASAGQKPRISTGQGVSEAQLFVAKYLQPPTSIYISTPLKVRPPKGKSIIYLESQTAGVDLVGTGLKAAAGVLGWKYRDVTYTAGQPASLQAAFATALALHPSMVFVEAESESGWGAKTISDYKKAGVRIVVSSITPVPQGGWVIGTPNSPVNNYLWGRILGAEFVADSQGLGKVAVEELPYYPGLIAVVDGFQAEVTSLCPACSVDVVQVTFAQVGGGQVPSVMVSTLQSHPGYNYVMFDYGAFSDGIDSQLAAAGLSNVKVFGDGPDTTNIAGLKSGSQLAWIAFPQFYQAWQGVDMYLRTLEKMPQAAGEQKYPVELLTQANINSTVIGASTGWEYPLKYQKQFEALWHVK